LRLCGQQAFSLILLGRGQNGRFPHRQNADVPIRQQRLAQLKKKHAKSAFAAKLIGGGNSSLHP